MTIKPTLFKKIVGSALLLAASFTVNAAAQWSGGGVITAMFIYPGYAIVEQGNVTGSPANCINNGRWTINWSQFDSATQQRIMSILLTARTTKQPLMAVIVDTGCGPEGMKLSNGQITF